MSYGAYSTGLLFLAGTVLAVFVAAYLVVNARLQHLGGAPRLLAISLVATTGLIWAHLIPGGLGILGRGAVALAALALLGAGVLLARADRGSRPSQGSNEPVPESEGPLPIAAAALAALAVLLVAVAYLRQAAPVPADGIDALSFHLPGAARWIQSGSIWGVDQFIPNQAQAYYPNNGDVLFLSAMLPFGDAAFVRTVGAPLLAMLGLAVYALAVELGAFRSLAVSFAAMFVSIPAVIEPALQGTLPDAFMLACFAAGILFGLRYLRENRRSELVLCGLGLGLAVGTKWYGVSSVATLLVIAVAALIVGGRPIRVIAREFALLAGVIAFAGGIWFLRNWIASGNPVFPLKVAPLGITIFDAPRDTIRELSGFTIADYATDWDVWRTYLLPALWMTLRLPVLLAAAGLGLTLWISLSRLRAPVSAEGADSDRSWAARVAVLGFGAIALVGVYAITPYSALGPEGMPVQADANTRYLLPAALIASALAAAGFSRLPRQAVPAVHALALVAIVQALFHGVRPSESAFAEAGAALLAVAATSLLLLRLARRGQRAASRAIAVAGLAVAIVLVVVAGRDVQRRIDTAPYRGADAALDRVLAADDVNVALAGEWDNTPPAPPFPSFGPRLENEVVYAGSTVEGMLRRYNRPGPFLRRLSEDRVDLLLVGRSLAPRGVAREARWAARAGWRKVGGSPRFLLFAP